MIEIIWPEVLLSLVLGVGLWRAYEIRKLHRCVRLHLGRHTYSVLSSLFNPYFCNESDQEAAGQLYCEECRCVIQPGTALWERARSAMPEELHQQFEARGQSKENTSLAEDQAPP